MFDGRVWSGRGREGPKVLTGGETEGACCGVNHPLTALLELVVHGVHARTKHVPAQGQRGAAGRSPHLGFLNFLFPSPPLLFGLSLQKSLEKLAPLSH